MKRSRAAVSEKKGEREVGEGYKGAKSAKKVPKSAKSAEKNERFSVEAT